MRHAAFHADEGGRRLAERQKEVLQVLSRKAGLGADDRQVDAGPWVELYGGVAQIVLNAQLQSAISIADYAELAGDGEAAAYADRLLAAAKAMLPRFDTGHWSLYSLGAQLVMWTVIGLVFASMADRLLGQPRRDVVPSQVAGGRLGQI